MEISNNALERLRQGRVALGMNARHSRTTEIASILKGCGYHWIFLDDEHSPMPVDRAYEISLASIRIGLTPCVRVRANLPHEIGRHMSNGALGIFIPHVNNAEEASRAARSCRFPPAGELSVPGAFPQFGYPGIQAHYATAAMNELIMVIVMIESQEAVDNAEAIAAVDGVDVMFIGLHDFTHEMGIQGQYGHPRAVNAVEKICKAARANGKHAGIGGVKENSMWEQYIKMGMRMILAENDLTMLVARAKERADFFMNIPLH